MMHLVCSSKDDSTYSGGRCSMPLPLFSPPHPLSPNPTPLHATPHHDSALYIATSPHKTYRSQETSTPHARPMIEVPSRTDVSWPGHRFCLDSDPSSVSQCRGLARGSTVSEFSCGTTVREQTEVDVLRAGDCGTVWNESLSRVGICTGDATTVQIRSTDIEDGTEAAATESAFSLSVR